MSDVDLELVEKVRRGDKDAFAAIVGRYQTTVFNAAYRIVGNAEDAADITQATFIKVFENIASFDPSFRFFSWLYRISVNESLNFRKGRRQAASLEVEPASSQPGPYEDFRQLERCEHLERALSVLSYDHRVVIVLKHLVMLSYRDIAGILDLPEKTVKSRLFAARQALHRQLVGQGFTWP